VCKPLDAASISLEDDKRNRALEEMMGDSKGFDRDQMVLFPAGIDDSGDTTNPVRFLAVFVDPLALRTLGLTYAPPTKTGRPASPPGDMRKLYRYGAVTKSRSSRTRAHETPRHIEVMG
jgi:hypothetical protein